MTVKEIAAAVGREERAVHNWVKATSANNAQVSAKIAQAKATSKAADYDLAETCAIIEEGLGKAAADVYRTNAVHAVASKPERINRLPSGAQMKHLLDTFGREGAAKRIDFCLGYSTKYEPVPAHEAVRQLELIKDNFPGGQA